MLDFAIIKMSHPNKYYADTLIELMILKGITIKQFLGGLDDAGIPGILGRELEVRLKSENPDHCLDVLSVNENQQLWQCLVSDWKDVGRFLGISPQEIEYQFKDVSKPIDDFVEKLFKHQITRGKFVDTMKKNNMSGLLRIRRCPELVECFSEQHCDELIGLLSTNMLYQFKVALVNTWQHMENVFDKY